MIFDSHPEIKIEQHFRESHLPTVPKGTLRVGLPATLGLFLALLLIGLPSHAKEQDTLWQLNTFGTLGYTDSSHYDERTFRRDLLQDVGDAENGFLVDSRLGLQVNAILSDQLEFVGQAVVRSQVSNRVLDYVDAAFLRYTQNDNLQFRVGRLPFDAFFLSDSRHVAYSYDWVRPPTETYALTAFNAVDGLRLVFNWGDFDSTWEWTATYGTSKTHFDNNRGGLESGATFDTVRAKPIITSSLAWHNLDWKVRLSHSRLDLESEQSRWEPVIGFASEVQNFWREPSDLLHRIFGNDFLYYTSFGASRQMGDWHLQAEYTRIDTDMAVFRGQQGYVHVARRFGDFTPFVTFRFARDKRSVGLQEPVPDPSLVPVAVSINALARFFKMDQDSVALGVRWDFAPKQALKLQCDRFNLPLASASIFDRVDGRIVGNDTRTWCSFNFDWAY